MKPQYDKISVLVDNKMFFFVQLAPQCGPIYLVITYHIMSIVPSQSKSMTSFSLTFLSSLLHLSLVRLSAMFGNF